MALRILRSTDPIEVKQLVLLLFGQPGIGKTSIGYTAEAPLLLDFDGGAHRSAFRKDTVLIESWAEIATLSPHDLEPYRTIVVDTGGRALDKLTAHIIRETPKYGTKSGALTLQGYGELKAVFTGWLKQLRELGKDVVLLAHDLEDKSGDDLLIRPDFTGGSKHEVIKVSDAVGYMYQSGKDKTLSFLPRDGVIGKDCCGIGSIVIPDFATDPDFLATVIAGMKSKLNALTEEQKAAAEALAEWKTYIDEAKVVGDFTALLKPVGEADESVRDNVRRLLWESAKRRGFEYDKEVGEFTDPTPAAQPGQEKTQAQAAG